MANPATFLNRHVLKPETVRAVESAGQQVSKVVDRWAGGWPKQTRKLEASGRLLPLAREQAEKEFSALKILAQFPDMGEIEAIQLADLPLNPPA